MTDAAQDTLPTSEVHSSAPATQDPAGADPKAPRIKIGSQRDVHPAAAPPAPPLVEGETQHGPAAEEPSSPVPAPEPTSRLAEKVSSDLRRAEKVPVPSIRRDLSPDLQVELELAMGGSSMDDLISSEKASPPAELAPETRLRGRIVKLHRDNVFVELGQPIQGVLPLRQFMEEPQVGAELEVMVARYDGEEGLYELTLPGGAIEIADWSQVAEGMVVEARVTAANKGGLECEVNKIRGFIPASQASLYRVENLETLIGEKLNCIVSEANPDKRNLVLSRRDFLEREREASRQELLATLAPGQVREGTVRNIQPFGAFVDLGGVDGLVHVSEVSWQRVKDPSEVLQVGQAVKVKIRKIDPETGKISLGMKELSESPWDNISSKYPSKSNVTGTVSKIMEFGAFVELEPGVDGLVHISELDHKRVFRVTDVVSVGQEIEAQVLSVDAANRRISLSIKALKARPQGEKKPEPEIEEPAEPLKLPKRNLPLKGGRDSGSGGERFGLKW